MFFNTVTSILTAFIGLALLSPVRASPLSRRDIVIPKIITPDANTVWTVGHVESVTWWDDVCSTWLNPPAESLNVPGTRPTFPQIHRYRIQREGLSWGTRRIIVCTSIWVSSRSLIPSPFSGIASRELGCSRTSWSPRNLCSILPLP